MKTLRRWTTLPVASYKYARGYGQSRREALRFAWDISAGSQWEHATLVTTGIVWAFWIVVTFGSLIVGDGLTRESPWFYRAPWALIVTVSALFAGMRGTRFLYALWDYLNPTQ